MVKEHIIPNEEEKKLLKSLDKREDADALRMKRYLSMPDLSAQPAVPFMKLFRILNIPEIAKLDVIKNPEIVPLT